MTYGVLLVPECGPAIGLGHLERMLALADRLGDSASLVIPNEACVARRVRDRGHQALTRSGALSDRVLSVLSLTRCVVVDAYTLPVDVQRVARAKCALTIVDDLGRPCDCDLAVNPSPGGECLRPVGAAQFLGGPQYALMSSAYLQARRVRLETPPLRRSVLVTTGATAARGLGRRVAGELATARGVRVTLVEGPDVATAIRHYARVQVVSRPPTLAPLLGTHELMCGAAGTTAVQAAAVGTPSIITAAFSNQETQAQALTAAGCAMSATSEALVPLALNLLDHPGRLAMMSRSGRAFVDGHGVDRVAEAVTAQMVASGAR